MRYSTDVKLSPFTITVGGETFDIPTYPISEEGNSDLLAMDEGSSYSDEELFVQRGSDMWKERWFVFYKDEMFSLRLVY